MTKDNSNQNTSTDYAERGIARFQEGHYVQALADLSESLRLDPTSSSAFVWRGATRMQLDQIVEALADFTEAIRLDPDHANHYLNRGAAYKQVKDFQSAIADFDEAIRLSPENVELLCYRGGSWFEIEEYENAVADYSEAIRLDPQCKKAHRWRGAARRALDQLDEAIADYSEAIRLDPENAIFYLHRGVVFQEDSDFDAAIADYSHVIQLDSTDTSAYLYRAQVYYRLGDCDEALTDLNFVLETDPSISEAFRLRGRIREGEEELLLAIADYTQAIHLDPENVRAHCNRGDAWAEIEEYEKAVADFTEALQLDPKNRSAYEKRAQAWDFLGEADKANADLDETSQLEAQENQSMTNKKMYIDTLLQNHFSSTTLDSLTITERRFPGRVRADLQRAIDSLFEKMKVHHFCGVHKQYNHEGVNFSELLVRNRNDPALSVPPQYEELEIGEEQPIRCLKEGLWLLEHESQTFAVFLEPGNFMRRAYGDVGMRFQVATDNNENGTRIAQIFFQHLERSVQEARSYRGKILSLEMAEHGYSGASTGINVHKLRTVERDQVILPRPTLELLERNIIQFVQQRERLAHLGLATKKGLLFYGPPGVGKTHTIHYLAGALEGMTTLLISAEQVGLLSEYMTLARLLQPSMVVIEDADLIARERTAMESVCEEVLLNKLLNEMDGLKEESDILFLLTTNRPETLEAALASRPGRIDQAIEFPLPDDEGRAKLVRLYSRGLNLTEEVVQATVKKTEKVSGAFIKELMRRAAQFQLERDGSGELLLADLDNALEELLFKGGSLNRKLLGGELDANQE